MSWQHKRRQHCTKKESFPEEFHASKCICRERARDHVSNYGKNRDNTGIPKKPPKSHTPSGPSRYIVISCNWIRDWADFAKNKLTLFEGSPEHPDKGIKHQEPERY